MKERISKIIENKKINFYINIFLILFIIFFSVYFLDKDLDHSKIIRDNDEDFALTNPILDCEYSDQSSSVISYSKVDKKVGEVESKYGINSISLYFRDLNNGPWVGVNEDEIFSPASLLKTPIAMALLKYAEDYPGILNKKISISKEDIASNANQSITFPNVLESGKEYTVEQVLGSMIEKSDNIAVGVIFKNIPENYIYGVFHSIGIPYKDIRNEVNIRVKDYAAFFRVLFNSSYLSRAMSEKLLEMLARTEYKNGIVAGVPEGVTVAHKFGERVIGDIYQLHDCGIVYYPENPYLLCIMTKGESFLKQQSAIKELSKFIYSERDISIKNKAK